jgi:hypothetical protein
MVSARAFLSLAVLALLAVLVCVEAAPVGSLQPLRQQIGTGSAQPNGNAQKPKPTPNGKPTAGENARRIAALEKAVAENAKKIERYSVRESQVNPDGSKRNSGRFAKKKPAVVRLSDFSCSQEWMFQEATSPHPSCPKERPYRLCIGIRGNGGFSCKADPVTDSKRSSSGQTAANQAISSPNYNPNARCGSTYGSCSGDSGGPLCKAIGPGASGFYCGN